MLCVVCVFVGECVCCVCSSVSVCVCSSVSVCVCVCVCFSVGGLYVIYSLVLYWYFIGTLFALYFVFYIYR